MSRDRHGGAVARLRRWLGWTLAGAVTVALAALILLEVYQITLRYVLAQSLPWARDVSGLLLFTLAWLGLPLLWLKRAHLSVSLFTLPSRAESLFVRALDALALVAAVALTICLWQSMAGFRFIEMPALGTSADVRFYPLLAGAVLFAGAALLNLLERRDS